MTAAEELLRSGRLSEALKAVEDQVRKQPADAGLRTFLFHVLCVRGQWERALTQLNVARDLAPDAALMAQVYGPAVQCEALRAQVFAGRRTPLVLGEPPNWVGLMIQANELFASGKFAESRQLRERALDAAPAIGGTIEHKQGENTFDWLADADSRLGPIFEAIIEGRYFWVPASQVLSVKIDPPATLRDVIWTQATFTWSKGGTGVALIPTRYPGSEASEDGQVQMARATDWTDHGDGFYTGLGQRFFATDAGQYPLLEIRQITLKEA